VATRAVESWSARLRTSSAGVLLGLGAGLGVASLVAYAADGYSNPMGILWLAALTALGAHFWRLSGRLSRVALLDVALPAALMAAFAPLYLLRLYHWPVQVGSDELVVMSLAKQYGSQPHVDLFGLSTHFGSPAATFVVWGKLSHLLGGVNLENVRLVHALVGVASIGLSYVLFRQLLPRWWSVFAAALLGLNHSFLMISRLAMRENTVVLVEVVAFALLLFGLRRNHPFATFCGGAAAGLGFYVHFPGRSIILVWAAFMVALAAWHRQDFGARRLLQASAIAAAGFALVATPYMIAYAKAPASLTLHQRQSLLVYDEGRKLQKDWVAASSELAGVAKNVEFGLTAFNRPIQDHAWIYQNPGHGFVDPLTGGLLWIGVGAVALSRRRGHRPPWALLGVVGFLSLWLIFAFVVGEAPDYPRMLLTLPLVAYLAAEGVRGTTPLIRRIVGGDRPWQTPLVATAVVVGIGLWNCASAWDYLQDGKRDGADIGSTGRYVEAHRTPPAKRFYVAADEHRWPYYVWGNTIDRIRLFVASDQQLGGMIEPERLRSFMSAPPFAIFMRRDLWSLDERALTTRYPHGRLRDITPDGRLVVFDVPRSTTT
jgi:hypothetical protein